jgi:hypothetical protein
MKIWLHFKKLLDEHKCYGNEMQISDVTMSIINIPKISHLLKMQDTFNEIYEI